MKIFIPLVLSAILCLNVLNSIGQSYHIGDGVYPDRSGKIVAFKATYSGNKDTVYFVDIASATVIDRREEGSYGLAFKMMKDKLVDKDDALKKELKSYHTYSLHAEPGKDKHEPYNVRIGDSLLAEAWLPKVDIHSDARAFIKTSPKTLLLATRINYKMQLYNMLDTLAGGFAKLLYSYEDTKLGYDNLMEQHLRNVLISPNGKFAFTLPDGVMVDVYKTGKLWQTKEKLSANSRVLFNEQGTEVAYTDKEHSVFVKDVIKGKQIRKFPTPPSLGANLKVAHVTPLADMQHCLIYYKDFTSSIQSKLILQKADGSYKEIRW